MDPSCNVLKHLLSPELPAPLSSMPSTSGRSDNAIPPLLGLNHTFSTDSDGTVEVSVSEVSCQMPGCYHNAVVCPTRAQAGYTKVAQCQNCAKF